MRADAGGPYLVAMVQTPKGHWGFPKGKRKKGESEREAALRELQEETGLTPEQIVLCEGMTPLEERSRRGGLATRYFVACTKPGAPTELAPEDPDELALARWVDVNDLPSENLRPRRAELVEEALAVLYDQITCREPEPSCSL